MSHQPTRRNLTADEFLPIGRSTEWEIVYHSLSEHLVRKVVEFVAGRGDDLEGIRKQFAIGILRDSIFGERYIEMIRIFHQTDVIYPTSVTRIIVNAQRRPIPKRM